jgi:hypothetical protein
MSQHTIIVTERAVETVEVSTGQLVVVERQVDVVEAGAQGPPGTQGPPGPSGAQSYEKIAGEALSALRAVRAAPSGELFYASHNVPADAHAVLGVTTTAAAAGGVVFAVGSGAEVTDAGWAWTPGLPVFLGALGALTQSPPASGFLLRVGTATSPTRLLVRIEEPVILG